MKRVVANPRAEGIGDGRPPVEAVVPVEGLEVERIGDARQVADGIVGGEGDRLGRGRIGRWGLFARSAAEVYV